LAQNLSTQGIRHRLHVVGVRSDRRSRLITGSMDCVDKRMAIDRRADRSIAAKVRFS
jgi:hypothetical protein